jgi:hypothetical protein
MATQKATCQQAVQWLRQRFGRDSLAPLTGQDWPALRLFIHATELWGYSDTDGRAGAIVAMRGALTAMQPKVRWLAREVIPAVLDWAHIDEIWPSRGGVGDLVEWETPAAVEAERRRQRENGNAVLE